MADYDGGMREHNPSGPESEKKGQKDERMAGVNSHGSGTAYRTVNTPRGLKGFSISKQCDFGRLQYSVVPSFSSQWKSIE